MSGQVHRICDACPAENRIRDDYRCAPALIEIISLERASCENWR
jgi:uncharacterized protein YcgI (DUF1989 family)